MRKPNCSERDAALGVLRDADQGVVQLSPEERDCLARVALAALMDECLGDDEFSGVEATLQRTECQRARSAMPALAPTGRDRIAGLRATARRTGRHWRAALRTARTSVPRFRSGRLGLATVAIGAAAVVLPIYALTGGAPRLQDVDASHATGLAAACLPGAPNRPGHTELVALQQASAGNRPACAKPGAAPPLTTAAAHHS